LLLNEIHHLEPHDLADWLEVGKTETVLVPDSRADFVGNQGNPLTQHTTLTPIMIVASGRQAAGVKDELDSQCADFILAALTIPRPVSCRREFAAFRLS
jgi:hypothetical protein